MAPVKIANEKTCFSPGAIGGKKKYSILKVSTAVYGHTLQSRDVHEKSNVVVF